MPSVDLSYVTTLPVLIVPSFVVIAPISTVLAGLCSDSNTIPPLGSTVLTHDAVPSLSVPSVSIDPFYQHLSPSSLSCSALDEDQPSILPPSTGNTQHMVT
ncbi:hypothetical protein GOBAR_DD19970 [Gossypium barbadense]|nr:hypothetical protein GOBAR_DD19970 [Gossypium barbadense]